jgi:hypothetical protein
MELRLDIDREFMKEVQSKVGKTKATDVMREALAFYNWAATEAANGRVVASSDSNGGQVKQAVLPGLERAYSSSSAKA